MLTFEYSTANRDMPVAYGSFRAMHTLCEVLIAGIARPAAEELIRRIYERAGVLESKFNRFDPQSGVSRMNRSAACGETTVDDELYGALEMCRVFNRSTCGSFDIAVQSEERPFGEAYLLQPSRHAVRFTGTGVTLDFGGFAKGYALERINNCWSKRRSDRLWSILGTVRSWPWGCIRSETIGRSGWQIRSGMVKRRMALSCGTGRFPYRDIRPSIRGTLLTREAGGM